ncbi:futalosine hydrolase [Rubripirellula reticaptiva]|uniref:Futalosine hydrolase n=1 Tax=Rubripirellula reticaptiva TaxID=2528013 RepID=A0A5C6EL49_9BACT|nr:futalosine hydrolase [Rubripirellula reticaptiva]TWU48311.1 Futalosine hydrolase [Rubripirellula reticaptiva]
MTDLILVPTSIEMQRLRPVLSASLADHSHSIEPCAFQLCGFGPIAAAARTAALIARYQPDRVLLIGIAGTFDQRQYPVGTSCRFDEVICDGIGVGSGDDFQSAESLGWHQFGADGTRPIIGDVLPLVSTFVPGVPCAGKLLTCPAASANLQDAGRRRTFYPGAVAEDMEGFGVATACSLAGVSLQIVRGLSNVVGDRDHSNWRIDDALASAATLAATLIHRTWNPTET